MIIFTQICIAISIIGVLLICMPTSWYTKSEFDFRRGGIWLICLTSSALTAAWLCYLIYNAILILADTFKMAGF